MEEVVSHGVPQLCIFITSDIDESCIRGAIQGAGIDVVTRPSEPIHFDSPFPIMLLVVDASDETDSGAARILGD